jgi:hypothetical protein
MSRKAIRDELREWKAFRFREGYAKGGMVFQEHQGVSVGNEAGERDSRRSFRSCMKQ